MNNVMKN